MIIIYIGGTVVAFYSYALLVEWLFHQKEIL